MSRQKGRRPRPAPERRAVVEKYSRRAARPRPAAASSDSDATPSAPASSWTLLMVGTLLSLVMYAVVASALVEAADGDRSLAGWLAAGAVAVVPMLLFALGRLSRNARPWRTAWLGSPAVVAIFLIGALVSRDVATGFVLAVGVGASFAIRLDEDAGHRRSWRLATAVGLALFTKVAYVASPSIAVAAAPLLPIVGVSITDSVAERRKAA